MGFGFSFFVKCHTTLCGLFNARAILVEESQWYYLTHRSGDKSVHAFPECISESEYQGMTEVRTRLLRCRIPAC